MLYEDKPTVSTPGQGVDLLLQANREAEDLEAKLKEAKAYIRELETKVLPDIFSDNDVTDVTGTSGAKGKFATRIEGSLPKVDEKATGADAAAQEARRQAAIALATKYGWGPAIKSKVTAAWDKGDREKAIKLVEHLRGDNSVDLKFEESIHANTLQSLARQRLEAGDDLDHEALGLTVLPSVKLTKKPKQ